MCLSFSICAPFLWIVFCNSHSRSRNWCTVTRYAAWLHAGSSHTLLSKQSATFILVSMLCYRWRFITKLKPWLSRNYSTIWMGPFSLLSWPHFSLPASSPFLCKYPLPGAPPSLFHLLYVIIELVKLFGEVGVKFKQIVSFTFYFFFPLLSKSFFYQTDCPSYMMLPGFFKLLRFSGCAYQYPTLPYRGSYGR